MSIHFNYSKHLERQVRTAVLRHFENIVNTNKNKIIKTIKYQTYKTFVNTIEYGELVSGDLLGEFGLEKGKAVSMVQSIVKAFSNQVTLEFKRGKLTIYAVKSDFEEILAMPEAKQPIKSKHIKHIDWLQWLLIEGDRILVQDHHFIPSYSYEKSRSGKGFMGGGGFWRVPPQYAGTIDDNWITRTIRVYLPFYKRLIQGLIIDYF